MHNEAVKSSRGILRKSSGRQSCSDKRKEVYMPETKTQLYSGNLENALFELVRQAVRAEVEEISRRNDDRLLTIDQVAQRLSVSKDWVYRNGKNSPLPENSDRK